MFKALHNLFFPPKPTALELAASELAIAEREKLIAETDREHAAASVAFRTAQIQRLRAYLASNGQ